MLLLSLFALSSPLTREAYCAGLFMSYGGAANIAYDDNLYLEWKDRETDVIYHLIPSVEAGFDSSGVDFKASYSLNYAFYQNHKEDNRTKPRDIQRLFSELNMGQGEGFSLVLTEEITSVVLDEAEKFTDSNDLVNRTNRSLFTASPKLFLESAIGSVLEITYDYKKYSYVSKQGDDSEEHTGNLLLKKKISEESELLLKGSAGIRDSSRREDFKKFEYGAGVARSRNGFLFSAYGGAEKLVFEESGEKLLGVWEIETRYPVLAESSLGMRFLREVAVSETGKAFVRRTAGADANLSGKSVNLALSAGLSLCDYLEEERRDLGKSARLTAGWNVSDSLDASAYVSYSNLDLSPSPETKNSYHAGASLKFSGRRTSLKASYAFRRDVSSVRENGFTSNTAFLEFSGKF